MKPEELEEAGKLAGEWIPCGACLGFGVVSKYSATDFEGPEECRDCGGNSAIWRYPSGVVAMYPGGPFRGKVAPPRVPTTETSE